MEVKDLKKGKSYYYTAGNEWVKVSYSHETINGYAFTNGEKTEVLTAQSVERHIEKIRFL